VVRINYQPRPQFMSFHEREERFACLVCHRRAGKTVACVHELQRAALRSTRDAPRFAYIGPTYSQTKSVAWDYLMRAAGPVFQYGAKSNTSELRVDYPNGSQVRLFGADNYDALRGLRLDGVVLDEFADFDPRAWSEVIRPALADRQGFAVFIGTPKGHNAFYERWVQAQNDPSWFALMLKASDAVPINDALAEKYGNEWAADRGLLLSGELKILRADMADEEYAQEFECSFEAAVRGAYYGKQMAAAHEQKRITGVPYDAASQVWTAWDLGMRDATAIWFMQTVGREVHLVDYYENTGVDLAHYVKKLKEKPYVYAGHIVPHDAQARELGTGKTRIEVLQSLGLANVTVAARHKIEDGINAVRVLLPRCWFDKTRCARGIEALTLYRSAWNDKLEALQSTPVHDWTSHAADAFRYLAMGLGRGAGSNFSRKIVYPKIGIA
jgi:hypothetical protein